MLTLTAALAVLALAPLGHCHTPHGGGLSSYRNKLGAVASEAQECTRIGLETLEELGGNAADALIATQVCVGVVGMYHSGVGGGGFMLVRASNGSYEFIDFRETAPAAAYQDMYSGNVNASLYGGLAVGVPGDLRGLERLWKGYASLPWATLFAGPIKVAREGFRISRDHVGYFNQIANADSSFLVKDPTWAIDFAPNGTLLGLGDVMTRKRYADTLEMVARYGPDAYYRGALANATITAIQRHNGTMALGDLANYTVQIRKPAELRYRDYKLTAGSAPSGGEVALAVMNIISGYNDIGWPETLNSSTHRLDEAMRFAYAERTQLGDPSFVANSASYQSQLVAPETGAAIRFKITDRTHNVSYYDPSGIATLQDHGTSQISAADASGLAISVTSTINTIFGSRVMVPETGVILNNEMNDFSIPGSSNSFGFVPSEANYIRPGKRPLSSISPVIVEHAENNTLYFVIGSAGGSRIITATIQNMWNVLDRNMTTAQALAMPRLHDQLQPLYTSFEYAYDNQTVAYLKSVGHNVSYVAPGQSTAQGVRLLPNGTFEAAGEPRQNNSLGGVV